ncbi:TAXI family TRAP transporter solute-binding subunit [Parahaliea mediterranea]|uniref:TAXI family TRAP transporter solute-binding subunit n=1 Tax=Parahaliea mediterranea TaxID=651086 RepID=UPI0013001F64|nr:TAXI family TRAP transporter solute-binding subunit [Parahaliea mediterranea]
MLSGCERGGPLRLHALTYQQIDVTALQAAIASEGHFDIVPGGGPADLSSLQALTEGYADLGIIDNSTPFQSGVRTVIPLYRSVLHLLVRDGVSLAQKRQTGEDISVYVVNDSHAGQTFLSLAAQRAGILANRLHRVNQLQSGVTDVIVYFGPINPQSTPWYQPGYSLVSLADAGEAAAEFLREGVSLLVPQLKSMEIPALTYNLPGNERPLQSLSVATLLVSAKAIDEERIYALTRLLVEQKPLFAALEPDIFSWVSERFDREKLNFPLHPGARRYFERDEPTPLERYADSINLLVYLAILLATGVVGLLRWRTQRKKDRVDTFYSRLLVIRERSPHEPAAELLEEVRQLELEAYRLLIHEKLSADESFRIFTDLLGSIRAELQAKAAAV